MATKLRSCRPSAAVDAVLLTEAPLDAAAVARGLESPTHGAVVTFLGVVRDTERGARISSITYQAYRGMAENELGKIARAGEKRWNVTVVVQHRIGKVPAGRTCLIVAVLGAHRREAFEACQFVIDEIKTKVPIWKVEYQS